MRSLVFEGNTWTIYEDIRAKNAVMHKSLRKLIQELLRADPTTGSGKPEALKHNLSGLWSRRINLKDRLIYTFDDNSIHIIAIGGHYE
jgi:toxin YoeB